MCAREVNGADLRVALPTPYTEWDMRGFAKFLAWFVCIFGIGGTVLYYTMFDVWTVPDDDASLLVSMAPNVFGGDFVILSRSSEMQAGELLRCDDPDSPGRFVVARMMGGSNESLDFTTDAVKVNGRRTPSPRACTNVKLVHPTTNEELEYFCHEEEFAGRNYNFVVRPSTTANPLAVTVPAGKIFLVSDNRTTHVDSRDYGAVDPSTCKHIVMRLVGTEGWFDVKKRLTLL